MDAGSMVAELEHAAHDARQRKQCSLAGLQAGAARLAPGGRARWDGARWTPLPYPGFAFQAMATADARNRASIERLSAYRDALAGAGSPGRIYPLPTASLHQTIINTFSAERLQARLIEPGLLPQFPSLLAAAFHDHAVEASETVRMSLIGIATFRTALGALGVFEDPRHYARVLALRARAYAHPGLQRIGLVRTRPFIGHITLAYLEAEPTPAERHALIDRIGTYNAELARNPLPYFMPSAVLCEYADLSAFTPHPANLAPAL